MKNPSKKVQLFQLGLRAFELLLRSIGIKNCFDSGFIS